MGFEQSTKTIVRVKLSNPHDPGVTLGHENGRSLLEQTVVFKDRTRLRGLLRGTFEAKIDHDYLLDDFSYIILSC